MQNKLNGLIAKAMIPVIPIIPILFSGCVPSDRVYPQYSNNNSCVERSYSYGTPGYSGSSYGETRDCNGNLIRREGAVWGQTGGTRQGGFRGLPPPDRMSPERIKNNFEQDVERARRQQRQRR